MADRDFLVKLTKRLMDEGKIIEAGFVGYRLAVIPKDASATQLDECQLAFFAGATHLYHSIMSGLDEGVQETHDDLRRMENIHNELMAFAAMYEKKFGKPVGNA